jgi:hypothetical protein
MAWVIPSNQGLVGYAINITERKKHEQIIVNNIVFALIVSKTAVFGHFIQS